MYCSSDRPLPAWRRLGHALCGARVARHSRADAAGGSGGHRGPLRPCRRRRHDLRRDSPGLRHPPGGVPGVRRYRGKLCAWPAAETFLRTGRAQPPRAPAAVRGALKHGLHGVGTLAGRLERPADRRLERPAGCRAGRHRRCGCLCPATGPAGGSRASGGEKDNAPETCERLKHSNVRARPCSAQAKPTLSAR